MNVKRGLLAEIKGGGGPEQNILPSHLLKIAKNMNKLIFFLVGQIKSGRFKLGLVNLGQVKWGHVKLQQSGLIKSSQNRSSQF